MTSVQLYLFTFGLFLLKHAGAIAPPPAPTPATTTAKHTECTCTCSTNTSIQTTTDTITDTSVSGLDFGLIGDYDGGFAGDFGPCNYVCQEIFFGFVPNQPIGFASQGTETILFSPFSESGIPAYCDCTNGSANAWTVFQRRIDGSVNFFRNWTDYVSGFGNASGEFWLGLETLHRFTANGRCKLRVDLADWNGNRTYAEYSSFAIGNSSTNYTLMVNGYSGNAGDAINGSELARSDVTNLMPFTTADRDNDKDMNNCATFWQGAWWFNSCFGAHLNGVYSTTTIVPYGRGVIWNTWLGFQYSLQMVEMKFRGC